MTLKTLIVPSILLLLAVDLSIAINSYSSLIKDGSSKSRRELQWSGSSNPSEFRRQHEKRIITRVRTGKPTIKVTQSEIEGILGAKNVTLECLIDSYPRSINFWLKGETDRLSPKNTTKYIIQEKSMENFEFRDRLTLQILNVDHDDLGSKFRCIASNQYGTSTGMIRLFVPPFLETSRVPADDSGIHGVSIGQRINLQCEVNGYPMTITYWFRANTGEQFQWSDDYRVTEEKISPTRYISRLHIRSVSKADYTVFTCMSKNSFGESQHTFRLFDKASGSHPQTGASCSTLKFRTIDSSAKLFSQFSFILAYFMYLQNLTK